MKRSQFESDCGSCGCFARVMLPDYSSAFLEFEGVDAFAKNQKLVAVL